MALIKKEDLRIEKVESPFLTIVDRDVSPLHIVEALGHQEEKYSYRRYLITSCGRVIRYGLSAHRVDISDKICKRCGDFERFENVAEQHREYMDTLDNERKIERAGDAARLDVNASWNATGASIEQGIMKDAQALVNSGKILVPFSKTEIARMGFLIECRIVALRKRAKNFSDTIDEIEIRDLSQMMDALQYDC